MAHLGDLRSVQLAEDVAEIVHLRLPELDADERAGVLTVGEDRLGVLGKCGVDALGPLHDGRLKDVDAVLRVAAALRDGSPTAWLLRPRDDEGGGAYAAVRDEYPK